MKPAPFNYVRPLTIEDALAMLDEYPDAVVLAGGQSLVAMLNMRLVTPSHVIDIGGLSGLKEVTVEGGWLRMGALVRHCDIIASQTVYEASPLLKEAALHIAHPAIRNRGTIGGSLALADPAAELPACLVALGGQIEIEGLGGTRHVDAADFRNPGRLARLRETMVLPAILARAQQHPVEPHSLMRWQGG